MRYPALISRQPGVITHFHLLKAVLPLLALPSSFCHRICYLKELYIYTYIYAISIKRRDYIGRSYSFLVYSSWFLKNAFTFGRWCYYAFTVTVSWCYVIAREWWFRVYSIHAENFLAFDQIQLDTYCAVVWRRFGATFKLRPVIPIFERNEMTECPRKPQQPTSIGITWEIQPFSMQSARSVSYRFFFCSCASSWFSSQGTINSMRKTLFFESDNATMSSRFSVWIMWTGNYRDILRFAETFHSLAPFSSFILFILGFFISSRDIHLPWETELWVPWL